ncbi:MAG: esterase/lipase family protein [Solimonas sp.]
MATSRPANIAVPTAIQARPAADALHGWRGLAALCGDAYAQASGRIHEFHRAIARQPFAALDRVPAVSQAAAPVRVLHDGITDAVYFSVRQIGGLVFDTLTASLATASRLREPATAPQAQPRLDLAAAAFSGAFGDHLAARRNPLAPRAGFYASGLHLALDGDSLLAAFPQARKRLAIFVHGLCCNETSWQMYAAVADPQRPATQPYGERLQAEGYSTLYLRYNSGAHISHNGRRLAHLLRQLVANWPVDVEEIVLVGHSMGGLVSRAAIAHGLQREQAWTGAVRHVFCLGTPHRGAALEKAVHGATTLMHAFELSRPWARALDARSVGIRDLRHGATAQADWRREKTRDWHPPQPLARAAQARYHFIGCSIGADERDWRGRLIGDGLVHLPSALAKELADADAAVLFGRHHLQLLNDAAVYALIAEQLGLAGRRKKRKAA